MNVQQAADIARTLIAAHGYAVERKPVEHHANPAWMGYSTPPHRAIVYVRENLDAYDEALTLLHEAVHVLQYRHARGLPKRHAEVHAWTVIVNFANAINHKPDRKPWPKYWPYKYRV